MWLMGLQNEGSWELPDAFGHHGKALQAFERLWKPLEAFKDAPKNLTKLQDAFKRSEVSSALYRILHVYIRGKDGRGWGSGTGCQWLAGLVSRVCV